jgi:hypothetical protein
VQFWSPASAQPRSKYPLNHCTVPLHAAKHTLMSKLCCQVLLALGRVGESEGRGRGSLLRTPPSSHSQPPTPWASMGRQERRRPDRKSVLDKAMLLRELQKSGSLELLGLIAAKLTSKQMPVGLHSQSACCQQGGGGFRSGRESKSEMLRSTSDSTSIMTEQHLMDQHEKMSSTFGQVGATETSCTLGYNQPRCDRSGVIRTALIWGNER